ncbi:MAG: molybdopterin cofactor-binding domain-containing protein [Pseudomonadota bacterium]
MNKLTPLSRRGFMQAGAGLLFSFSVAKPGFAQSETDKALSSAFVEILGDGTVKILSPAAEMGNGSLTAIPIIVAEEMDADWDQVVVDFTGVDDQAYSNPTFWHYGIMLTAGSSSVSGFYDQMRLTGAQIRKTLIAGAADMLSVPAEELSTEPGMVMHASSGQSLTFGEIAAAMGTPDTLPEVTKEDLKDPGTFRLIGHADLQRRDAPAKVHGDADLYSIDVELPGMLYATVTRTCFTGRVPLDVPSEADVLALPNVVAVTRLPDAVAVVASTYEAALAGEELMQVTWSQAETDATYSSDAALDGLASLAEDTSLEGMDVMALAGAPATDFGPILEGAARVHAGSYRTDFMYHAQIEPLNAVAHVTEGGAKVELWAGTQTPSHLTRAIGDAMSVAPGDTTLHRSYLGGAFGRRAAMDHDWALDAVRLSKIHAAPVKSIWSREMDIHAGRFRPITAHYLQAAEDADGTVASFYHRVASDTPLRMSDQYRFRQGNGFPVITTPGLFPSYNYAHYKAEIIRVESDVRVSPMRGVGAFANVFAMESFFDEVAHEQGTDPLEFRRGLTQGNERGLAVLDKIAEMTSWDARPGLGLCFTEGRMAIAVELDVDPDSGALDLKHVWCATDVGVVVHPNNAENQVVGGLIFHLSNSLRERITFTNGQVDQRNYYNYDVLKMADIPPIDVHFMASTEAPEGVGDFGTEAIAAALANAIFSASGKRLRHAPLTQERIAEALKA